MAGAGKPDHSIRETAARLLKEEIPAVMIAMHDPAMPLTARLLAAAAVGYMLSPIDLIPDFIPVLGYLDDVVLVPALITAAIRHIPAGVWQRSLARAREEKTGVRGKWYYAIPVILIWALLISWLIRIIRSLSGH